MWMIPVARNETFATGFDRGMDGLHRLVGIGQIGTDKDVNPTNLGVYGMH